MPSILEQLGIDTSLTPPAGGAPGITPEGQTVGAAPVAEANASANLGSSKEIADTIVAGAVAALEQVVGIYGYTTEEGKNITKAIDNLMKVVPESKIKEVQGQLGAMLSGGGIPAMPPTGAPAGAPAGAPPAMPPAAPAGV